MPSRSSSSMTAPMAARRGSAGVDGIGSAGGSITMVALAPRPASTSRDSPSSGNRSASRTAAATSATDSDGGGGRRTTASSGPEASTSREAERRGARVTGRFKQGAVRGGVRIRLGGMSPKAMTGLELDLDDAPARDSELFLVDGNNLAYRAFFALPEELATTDGFPTNALLGFTNMLFKLLSDYKPKGVAVAWDTRPVHRAAVAEAGDVIYKEGRKPMADLLREQFPYFRPIVEAFGYRNLEFEGWEADDVIATLAHRADDAGLKTTVVSTDRDAFQLVTGNVALMMTPRGVADVHVYTPDRVFARYGVTPEQVPDFIGLKGDTSDNIPGVPGIGDKTAGQLVAQYGSLEGVLEHVDELSPARGRALREHAEQARASKELATMRRDLQLDCDPAQLVLNPPDRSRLKEMFRQYEFRNLLQRVDVIDEALPAAPMKLEGVSVPWREGELSPPAGEAGIAVEDGRLALAQEEVVVAAWTQETASALREADLVAHDAKPLRVEGGGG